MNHCEHGSAYGSRNHDIVRRALSQQARRIRNPDAESESFKRPPQLGCSHPTQLRTDFDLHGNGPSRGGKIAYDPTIWLLSRATRNWMFRQLWHEAAREETTANQRTKELKAFVDEAARFVGKKHTPPVQGAFYLL